MEEFRVKSKNHFIKSKSAFGLLVSSALTYSSLSFALPERPGE